MANLLLRGNWTDQPCWYATITDTGKVGFLLGPFPTEASCRQWAYRDLEDGGDHAKHFDLVRKAHDRDPWSAFYAWGMVKLANGYKDGCLNKVLPEAELDAVRAVPCDYCQSIAGMTGRYHCPIHAEVAHA